MELELSDIGLAISDDNIIGLNESVPVVDFKNTENVEDVEDVNIVNNDVNTVSNILSDSLLLLSDYGIDTHKDASENLNGADININNLTDEVMLELVDEAECSLENKDTANVLIEIPVVANEIVEELAADEEAEITQTQEGCCQGAQDPEGLEDNVSDNIVNPLQMKEGPKKEENRSTLVNLEVLEKKGRTQIRVIFLLMVLKLKKNSSRSIFVFAKTSAMKRLM